MTKAVKLARAVGTGGVLEDGEIQAAQVTGLATVASTNSYTDLINKPTIPSITGLASQTYVNTQINNLINGAPGTLDTLKEIADQLSTDQSAVAALTTVVNSKASTASLATVATTGSYSDLINKPAGGTTYLKKTANYTAADRDGIIADTSAGTFTVFLPATPTLGMQVAIVDGNNWGTNNLTVGRNGSTIEGLSENLTLDIAGVSVQLIYDGTTWEVFAQAGVLGANTVQASSVVGLATVATTGSYVDLTNKPTILSTISQDTAPQLGGSLTTTGHNIRGGPYEANSINLDVNASISAVRSIGGANGGVIVGTGTGNTADKFWIFKYDGGLKFPDSTTQTTAWTGTYSYTNLTDKPDLFPTQTSNSGKFLTTNGTATSWATVDALPTQTSNSGKFLTTNGTVASWQTAVTPGPINTNTTAIIADYAIPTGTSAQSVGPITHAANTTLTIAAGQRWQII
jgi:hypothetical protein